MAADIFVADVAGKLISGSDPALTFNDDGCYWFLYPYFEKANLDRRSELVDLYGDSEIGGYQLERLRDELLEAKFDATNRPETWKVLVGWNAETPSRLAEKICEVTRSEMLQRIDLLLGLVEHAGQIRGKLVVVGD